MTAVAPWAPLLVTVIFSATGMYCVIRTALGFSALDRVNNGVHVLMSATMALMPWPAYAVIPSALPIAAFTAAALWYVYLAIFVREPTLDPIASHHAASPVLLGYHAVMMAGMVWMAVAMTPVADGTGSMSMSGMRLHGSSAMTGSAGWAVDVSIAWGAGFALAAIWFLVRLVRQGVAASALTGRAGVALLDTLLSLVMAAGMSLAFLLLMT